MGQPSILQTSFTRSFQGELFLVRTYCPERVRCLQHFIHFPGVSLRTTLESSSSMARRGGRWNVSVWRHAQALMYMVVILQLVGAACALVAGPAGPGGFHRPEGGEDGIYQGFVNENGEKHVKFVGKANTTSPGPSVTPVGGPGRKLLDTGVHCQGNANMGASDAISATNGLANYFGGGNSFSHVISVYWGSAVAYGCDYGNGQWTNSGQIWNDETAISNTCGAWDQAGWYAHESWKSSYGRCSSSWGYC